MYSAGMHERGHEAPAETSRKTAICGWVHAARCRNSVSARCGWRNAACRQNLDAITGKDHWGTFGTTGDAKGQPVQINHPSHGSPWCRIRRIMVGAAYS